MLKVFKRAVMMTICAILAISAVGCGSAGTAGTDRTAQAGGAGDHDHGGCEHCGHDHSGHSHAGHEHTGHEHCDHEHCDHAGHGHAGHGHAGHEHCDHEGCDHHDHAHRAQPEDFAAGVAALQQHHGTIRDSLRAGQIAKADEAVHAIGHLLERLPALAEEAGLSGEAVASVRSAAEKMFAAYAEIDHAIHADETPDYDTAADELDQSLADIRQALDAHHASQ
jgi:hypothetical protein